MTEEPPEGIGISDKDLEEMNQKVEKLDPSETKAQDIFNKDFIKQHTDYNDFESFVRGNENLKDGEIDINDIGKLTREGWEKHVNENTDFNNWNQMLVSALIELDL